MSSTATFIASPVEIEFDGGTFLLPPLTLAGLNTIADYMRSQLIDNVPAAIAAAKETGDPATVAIVTREALREQREAQNIPPERALTFIDTIDGISFALWMLLDQQYPGGRFTRDGVLRSIIALSIQNKSALQRLGNKLSAAAGIPTVGNDQPAAGANPAAGESTGQPIGGQ